MTANMNIFRNSNDTIKLFYFAQFFLLLLSTFSATAEEYASLPRLSSHFEQRFRPPEGSTFLLKCPFESIASVEWELNGKPLNRQKSSAVDFPTISRTDSGIYRCTIRSHFGVVFSPALNVTVLYIEDFADEPDTFYQVKSVQNKFLILQPPRLRGQILSSDVRWKWFYESEEILPSDSYYVTQYGELVMLTPKTGYYQVVADYNGRKVFSKNYDVSEDFSKFPFETQFAIVYQPRDVQAIFGHRLETDTNLVFECVPTTWSGRTLEILWYLNNQVLLPQENIVMEHGNRRLIIVDVLKLPLPEKSMSHSATIRCLARTSDGFFQDHARANLEILEIPQILQTEVDKYVIKAVGESAKLVCKAITSWPRAKFFWYFNGVKLSNVSSSALSIDNIRQNDFGIYQCEAVNTIGSDVAQFWLRNVAGNGSQILLHKRVEIVDAPADVVVKEGEDIVLPCRQFDLKNVSISWKFNNKDVNMLRNDRLTSNVSALTVKLSRTLDAGKYSCIAKSLLDGSVAEMTFNVAVMRSKLIQYGPSNQSMLIGSNIQMPCKIFDDLSKRGDLKVTWARNNQEIPVGGDLYRRISIVEDGSLLINQVGPDNIGTYTCTVNTVDGEHESATAQLKIIEKPSMPQNVQVELRNDSSITKILVNWETGFDGNSPINRYTVEVRTKKSSDGEWSNWETAADNIPPERCCSAVVDNIRPSEYASFRVISHNRYGAGKPSLPSKEIKVPQQPPADAPRQVHASARSSSSIMVQWQPPPPGQWNGDIKGYSIRYRLSGYSVADWNWKNISDEHARNALIEPLITWREYDVQVAAYNDRGLGVFSKPIEVTTLEGVPMQSPQNLEVEVLNSTSIRVSFDPPDQQMVPGVNLGYKVELWKGEFNPTMKQHQPPFRMFRVFPQTSRITEQIDGLEKFGHYNLTILCFTAPGDGPRSEPVEVVTAEDFPGPIASITFDQILYSSVLVKWEPPSSPNGVILKYALRYWEAGMNEKRTLETTADKNSINIDGLSASTNYSIDIQAFTRVGGGPRVEAKFESGITPELPERPLSLSVADIGPRSVALHFTPGFDGHSYIRRWIVEARVGANSIFSTIFNVSEPKARSLIVNTLRPYTKYQLRLIAENIRGRSAPSDPTRQFFTSQTFPERAPERVFAEPISANQIEVAWTPLLPSHWNGEPIGYLILIRPISNASLSAMDGSDGVSDWTEIVVPNPKESSFLIPNLRPNTAYQVRVCAKNVFGNGQFSDAVLATTYEGVPGSAPQNVVAVSDDNEVAVDVQWREVEETARNGRIIGYMVRLVPEKESPRSEHSIESEILGADIFSAKFNSALLPFTVYRVFVSAFTLIGEGPQNANPPSVLTKETLPGKPSNVSFVYKSESELRLAWDNPTRPNGRIRGFAIRYWRADRSEEDAINTQIPENIHTFPVVSVTPDTTYAFAIKAENSIGWGPERVLEVRTSHHDVPLPIPSIPSRNTLREQYSDKLFLNWAVGADERGHMTTKVSPVRQVEAEYRSDRDVLTGQDYSPKWTRLPRSIDADIDEIMLTGLKPNTGYKVRIRFVGDVSAQSGWSDESDWIKTLAAPPAAPPKFVHTTPYESSSALVKWLPIDRTAWNSDKIGYRIMYRIYPSNDSFSVEDVPTPSADDDSDIQPGTILSSTGETLLQHVLRKLSNFHHYVIQMKSVNQLGASRPSRPVFVYVGYSVPKQKIRRLAAESHTSLSVQLTWEPLRIATSESSEADVADGGDLISGYRIRYTPLLSPLSPEVMAEAENSASSLDLLEEIVTTDKNECVLSDLRKFTEYQISVTAYNRAGESEASIIRVRTLEDLPGPVGPLIFQDILLNSVNVSWASPQQPNGRIQGYVVKYRTYKMADEFRKEIQERTQLTYLLAENLEENVTYQFFVRAETSAGLGVEMVGNVTTGYNEGAPFAVEKPSIILEHNTFLLRWTNNEANNAATMKPVKGHMIQAKRVGSVVQESLSNREFSISATKQNFNNNKSTELAAEATTRTASSNGNSRMKRSTIELGDFRPRHPIGEWFTLSNVLDGEETEYRVSYRQLEPASYYVFRVFARNQVGISRASDESEQLFVPASLPDDPFWNQWWFLVIVGLLIVLVVFVFVATLWLTTNGGGSSRNSFVGGEKQHDGGAAFDTLQLSDGQIVSYELHSKHLKRAEELSRPNTHTSWISNGGRDTALSINNGIGGGGGIYGSINSAMGIAGGVTSAPLASMYQALATDALPSSITDDLEVPNPDVPPDDLFGDNSGLGSGYMTRKNLMAGMRKNSSVSLNCLAGCGKISPQGDADEFSSNRNYQQHIRALNDDRLAEYGYSRFMRDEDYEDGGVRFDSYNNGLPSTAEEPNIASHYQSNDQANRATWRRNRQQAVAHQQQKQAQNNGYSGIYRPNSQQHYRADFVAEPENSDYHASRAAPPLITPIDYPFGMSSSQNYASNNAEYEATRRQQHQASNSYLTSNLLVGGGGAALERDSNNRDSTSTELSAGTTSIHASGGGGTNGAGLSSFV